MDEGNLWTMENRSNQDDNRDRGHKSINSGYVLKQKVQIKL